MLLEQLQSSALFSAFVLNLLFIIILLKHDKAVYRYLIWFLAIDALGFMCEWLTLHGEAPTIWAWLSLLMVSSFFLAPCLWLFTCAITDKPKSFFALPKWHFVLIAIGCLLTLPLFSASDLIFNSEESAFFGKLIHVTMILSVGVFGCQVPIYLYGCIKVLLNEVGKVKNLFASLSHPSLSILRVLVMLLIATWSINLLRTLNAWMLGSNPAIGFSLVLLDGLLAVVGLFVIFYRLISPTQSLSTRLFQPNESSQHVDSAQQTEPTKYAKVLLDNETRERIKNKLNDADKLDSHLCASNISLPVLAKAIGEKPAYVTQVLNQDLNTNFYEFVTLHRIEQVKERLIKAPQQNILDLALEVGFNSKSAFNNAFKKITGTTPTAYRKQ